MNGTLKRLVDVAASLCSLYVTHRDDVAHRLQTSAWRRWPRQQLWLTTVHATVRHGCMMKVKADFAHHTLMLLLWWCLPVSFTNTISHRSTAACRPAFICPVYPPHIPIQAASRLSVYTSVYRLQLSSYFSYREWWTTIIMCIARTLMLAFNPIAFPLQRKIIEQVSLYRSIQAVLVSRKVNR